MTSRKLSRFDLAEVADYGPFGLLFHRRHQRACSATAKLRSNGALGFDSPPISLWLASPIGRVFSREAPRDAS
jgi:hypothetical protein